MPFELFCECYERFLIGTISDQRSSSIMIHLWVTKDRSKIFWQKTKSLFLKTMRLSCTNWAFQALPVEIQKKLVSLTGLYVMTTNA